MSIIDIISLNNSIMALTRDGYLVCWANLVDLEGHRDSRQGQGEMAMEVEIGQQIPQSHKSNNIQPQPQPNTPPKSPFLPQHFQHKLSPTPTTYLQLLQTPTHLIAVSQKQLKIIRIPDLENFIKKNKNKEGKARGDLPCWVVAEDVGIGRAVAVARDQVWGMDDEGDGKENVGGNCGDDIMQITNIIYSTKSGKILSLQLPPSSTPYPPSSKPTPQTITDIKSFQFQPTLSEHEHVTCLLPYRDNNLLLAGTSSGRILIVNVKFQKIIEDIVKKSKMRLTCVRDLVMSCRGHRFYSLHDGAVLEWALELQKCVGYYTYSCPLSVLYTQRLTHQSPKLLICSHNKFLTIISEQSTSQSQHPPSHSLPHSHKPAVQVTQLQTNLQSIEILKQIDGKIFCGGRHGIIEVLHYGICVGLLYRVEGGWFV